MNKFNMFRITAVSPDIELLDIDKNTDKIIERIKLEEEKSSDLVLFPERTICGATVGDIIAQREVQDKILMNISKIVDATKKMNIAVVLGSVIELNSQLYNCSFFIQKGKIKGIVPKIQVQNTQDRMFVSGIKFLKNPRSIKFLGEDVPFGYFVFEDKSGKVKLGMEVGSDIYSNLPVSFLMAQNGADIILNPWAEEDTIINSMKRKQVVQAVSGKSKCGYVVATAGTGESVTDGVFCPQHIFAEVGAPIKEDSDLKQGEKVTVCDLDLDVIKLNKKEAEKVDVISELALDVFNIGKIDFELSEKYDDEILRVYDKTPLQPKGPFGFAMCKRAFEIQSMSLARRIETINAGKCVVGISGGLDSTLAILVGIQAMKILGRSANDVLAITMQGFGTTGKTYDNACRLMETLGAEIREIPIKKAVEQHFQDIGHNPEIKNTTYENAQARERTQILMDIANEEKGLVLGTGDLSESALGWCTFNGDHMAMYGVNNGVSKTFIKSIITWFINEKLTVKEDDEFSLDNVKLQNVLQEILDTPISPELLPPDENGDIKQKTEETIGPYEIHDFFLYHILRQNMSPKKLLKVAIQTYKDEFPKEEIKRWLIIFYKRFFGQQFKRNCSTEGAKIGSISLSPRGAFSMPSDLVINSWIEDIEKSEV